jgi:hypothetical protein
VGRLGAMPLIHSKQKLIEANIQQSPLDSSPLFMVSRKIVEKKMTNAR